ncbi:MAG: SDR family oxidoreductase [Eubacteriales bacterium]|nr:SDR family oxidoreductase [Eubacteriales bacterium]
MVYPVKPPFALRAIEEGLKDKVVIITGGTSGIGKACVDVFAFCGSKVIIVGRNAEAGQAIEKEVTKKYAGECKFIKCDVSNENEVISLINAAVDIFKGIDVVVNCAGYFPDQVPVDQVSVQDFKDILQTNVVGLFAVCKYVLPYLRTSKGNIVNIGSSIATIGDEGATTYCATKGAVESFSKTLAIDEARNGVRVNEIKPGNICNEMFARYANQRSDADEFLEYNNKLQWMSRGGASQEVATAVAFLASEWASFITGASLMVTGGYDFGEGIKQPIFNWDTQVKK